jgi:hypothetical protein
VAETVPGTKIATDATAEGPAPDVRVARTLTSIAVETCGAVYSPPELIVPTAEGSPAVPLTDQVTLEVGIPPAIAENCTVPPAATAAEPGVIVIAVATPGLVWLDEGTIELPPPHPALKVASAIANTKTANPQCDFVTSAS